MNISELKKDMIARYPNGATYRIIAIDVKNSSLKIQRIKTDLIYYLGLEQFIDSVNRNKITIKKPSDKDKPRSILCGTCHAATVVDGGKKAPSECPRCLAPLEEF